MNDRLRCSAASKEIQTSRDSERSSSNDEKGTPEGPNLYHDILLNAGDYEGKPTVEELKTLRRVPGKMPTIAYLICFVEFCERASYYGVQQLIGNFVNRPLPRGGNGYGAPPAGTQETAGALGLGTVSTKLAPRRHTLSIFYLCHTSLPNASVLRHSVLRAAFWQLYRCLCHC